MSFFVSSRHGVILSPSLESLSGLGWNCIGLLAIMAWTGSTTFAMFYILKIFNQLRVEPGVEYKGNHSFGE